MNAFTVEMIQADSRVDASAAARDFYDFCADGPGVVAEDVLATMRDGERTRTFWANALRKAGQVRKAWLAA